MSGKERLRRNRSQPKEKEISRRSFLRLALPVGAAVVAVGGAALVIDQYRRNQTIEDKLTEFKKKETELGYVLPIFEDGYGEFAEKAKVVIKTHFTDKKSQETLFVPFKFFEANKNNPMKNGWRLVREEFEKHRSLEGVSEVRLANADFFLYATAGEYNGVFARYIPRSRTLVLPQTYTPQNLLDNLVVTHELIHVAQDTEDRNTLPRDIYVAFYSTPSPSGLPKTVDLYEAQAYIAEIELANLMTGGRFRELVLAQEKDLAVYRDLFVAQPVQDAAVKVLVDFAYNYYASSKTNLHKVGEDFLKYVRDFHRDVGYEVYTRVPSGYAPVRE